MFTTNSIWVYECMFQLLIYILELVNVNKRFRFNIYSTEKQQVQCSEDNSIKIKISKILQWKKFVHSNITQEKIVNFKKGLFNSSLQQKFKVTNKNRKIICFTINIIRKYSVCRGWELQKLLASGEWIFWWCEWILLI